jgi:predicted nucleic acid-binding protein
MPKAVISDTSCLITLAKIGELELLHKTYGEVITTKEVSDEYGENLPAWVKVVSPKDKSLQEKFETKVDKGEASSIALALELKDCIVFWTTIKRESLQRALV